VLAGPILRDVTPTSVTVWLAMRVGATVVLTVKDEQNVQCMRGQQRSISIGRNLHIVAIAATPLDPAKTLSEGFVYQYDLAFNFDGNFSCNLSVATNNAKLAYPPWTLPSFSLPPRDLNSLRLIHGSCRKVGGEGKDMLAVLDDLIQQSAPNAYARPHQLFLTGDQIYADDVTDPMRMVITDAADALLEWQEVLPAARAAGGPNTASNLSPARRFGALTLAGFTSDDLRAHLMSLGEYLAMYLFAWSDVLWPPSLPTIDDVLTEVGKDTVSVFIRAATPPDRNEWRSRDKIQAILTYLEECRSTLSKVRCALANVPSYMIFDDHEVTDDWNMTRQFCDGVYGADLGRRVVQNALVAYSLCQHWGNVPQDFLTSQTVSEGMPLPPGFNLLGLVDTPNPTAADAFNSKADDYVRLSPALCSILSVHDAAALSSRADHAVFHDDSGALRYNFTVTGPSHQVIVTDTRTWRSYPRSAWDMFKYDGTHLLTKNAQTDQFNQQIRTAPAPSTADGITFVVVTTNAPPVQPIRSATRHDMATNALAHNPDIYEAWDLPSPSFDRLLVALTDRLPLDASGQQHTGAVILLSGDVHMSFASRILYRATARFEDDVQPRGAAAVIAQLVASSFKKQTDDTIGFHRDGYFHTPKKLLQVTIRHELAEGYVGWNFPAGTRNTVGTTPMGPSISAITIDKETVDVTRGEPLKDRPNSNMIDLTVKPHYRYRLDYLLPDEQVFQLPVSPIGDMPPGSTPDQRKAAARTYSDVVKSYQKYNKDHPPVVVGLNSLSEIKLAWGTPDTRTVQHIVRWLPPQGSNVRLTTYTVRLDVNAPTDKQFPDIKARTEP
jgi:hypothetical protein